jgi:hypothetical protein
LIDLSPEEVLLGINEISNYLNGKVATAQKEVFG